MKIITLICLSLLFHISIQSDDEEEFQKFKKKYKKTYKSSDEEEDAYKKFRNNRKKIYEQNVKYDKRESKFRMDIWNFTDLCEKDFATKRLNGFIDRPKERFIQQFNFDFIDEIIPENLNYTAKGLVTSVMFQGLCGSCWSFAAIGAIEGQLKKSTGVLTKLSEQNLIDCNFDSYNGNWGCNGGNMVIAFAFIARQQRGIVPLVSYSYKGVDNHSCAYNSAHSIGTISSWVELPNISEEELKHTLANIGPIAVAVDASLTSFQQYKSGIYDDINCKNYPNHAVLLTGYGVDERGTEYWIIKNSWDKSWGEEGYMRLARNAKNLCNIAMVASYPII